MAAVGWSLWFDRCGSVSWLLHRSVIVGAVLIGCCRTVAMDRSLWFDRRGRLGTIAVSRSLLVGGERLV